MDLWNSIILYSNGIDRVFLWYNMLAIDNFLAPRKNVTLTYNYQDFFIEIYWILEILCLSGSFILMISMHVCVQFNFIDILWGQSKRSTGLETRQKSSHSEGTETSQKCSRLSR